MDEWENEYNFSNENETVIELLENKKQLKIST